MTTADGSEVPDSSTALAASCGTHLPGDAARASSETRSLMEVDDLEVEGSWWWCDPAFWGPTGVGTPLNMAFSSVTVPELVKSANS
jgi:hypothetical protein